MVCSPVPKIHVAHWWVGVSVSEDGGCSPLLFLSLYEENLIEAKQADVVGD